MDNNHTVYGIPISQYCGNKSEAKCDEINNSVRQAETKFAYEVVPVVDEIAKFVITPYGAYDSYQNAKTPAEKLLALSELIPAGKLANKAKSLLSKAADLYQAGKFSEAKKYLQEAQTYMSQMVAEIKYNPFAMQTATPNGAKSHGSVAKPSSQGGGQSKHSLTSDEIKDLYKQADHSGVPLNLSKTHNSSILSDNLEKAGVPKPAGTQAHHIVGQTTQVGKDTKKLLDKFGINVNSPINGVFLPGCGASNAVGMIHCGKHTVIYEREVWRRLRDVSSRQEAIKVLQKIRNELLDNTFTPLNKRSL